MSKPDAAVARTIPIGILVSVDNRRKSQRTVPKRKAAPRERGPQIPWLWIVTGGSACWALLILVIGVCSAGSAPEQPSNPTPVIEPIALVTPAVVPAPKAAPPEAPRVVPPLGQLEIGPEPLPKGPAANLLLLETEIIPEQDVPGIQIVPDLAKPEPVKPKAPAFRDDVDLKVYASCKQIGSNVLFMKDPPDAFRKAKAEKKLVFMVHLSGNLENPDFT